jgi:ankyrin repeat protein
MGADPMLSDNTYCCALEAAINSSEDGIAKALLERDNSIAQYEKIQYSPLTHAAQQGLQATVGALIRLGADVNAEDKGGELHWRKQLNKGTRVS